MIKPMLFNTDMVRAILEGRKTVTRRAVKLQPKGGHSVLDYDDEAHTADILCGNGGEGGVFADWAETVKAPCWPGDILWVRETWRPYSAWIGSSCGCEIEYKAGGMERFEGLPIAVPKYKGSWRPSIHMPRETARIFLRITDVRVERLQEITAEGALDEGTDVKFPEPKPSYISLAYTEMRLKPAARQSFSELWDSTIKPKDRTAYGWAANPWVWVIEFERCNKPEGFA